MRAPAETPCEGSIPRATKGKGETSPVNAEQAGRHKAELLHQKSVAPDAHGKADHGDIGHEKCNLAVAGKAGMRGQQKRAYQAAQRPGSFEDRNPVHHVSLALCSFFALRRIVLDGACWLGTWIFEASVDIRAVGGHCPFRL